jgi:hypothetical protein
MTESKYIFIRDNMTGEPTLKHAALAQFKANSIRETRFFDDLAAMRRELKFLADRLHAQAQAFVDSNILELSVPALTAIPCMDPKWFPAMIETLEQEMDLIVQLWRNRIRKGNSFRLPKTISAMYTAFQEDWIPDLNPEDMSLSPQWLPFMKEKDRLFHMHLKRDRLEYAEIIERDKKFASTATSAKTDSDVDDDVEDIVLDELEDAEE